MDDARAVCDFDPTGLLAVETLDHIRSAPADSVGLLVRRLNDQKLAAIAARSPGLLHLIADGSNSVTDSGLAALRAFSRLEHLDLEWSSVTDVGLPLIAAVRSLRWVDLGFCAGVSPAGLGQLRELRPDLEVVETHSRR